MAGAKVILLTSAGQLGDATICRELAGAGILPKPIRRSQLRGAILSALGSEVSSNYPELLMAGRILLVEDNKVNQLVAKRLLEKRGHKVIVANNGRHALAILDDEAEAGFDCVLMDIQMPEMGGLECTEAIRERERMVGSHVQIIAITAHAMEGDKARCLAAGMDAYLSKPLQPESFVDVVEGSIAISRRMRDERFAPGLNALAQPLSGPKTLDRAL
jgi:CheY-like chemotaxis protein